MEAIAIQNARLWDLASVLLKMFVCPCVCVRGRGKGGEGDKERRERLK